MRGGVLHREIHVIFMTPKGEIIFQHRGKNKDTYPNKLDVTVGGHVEPGMSYEETALKESKEETGVDISLNELVFLRKMKKESFDNVTGMRNNVLRNQYAYLYKDSIENLKTESNKGEGFEVWKIDDLINISDEDKNKFIPFIISEDMINLYIKAKEILLK